MLAVFFDLREGFGSEDFGGSAGFAFKNGDGGFITGAFDGEEVGHVGRVAPGRYLGNGERRLRGGKLRNLCWTFSGTGIILRHGIF